MATQTSLARQTPGQQTANVLNDAKALIIIQDIPGRDGFPLINLPWRLVLNGSEIAKGVTDERGRVIVRKELDSGKTYDLEYPGRVLKIAKLDFEDISAVKGMQQRLAALGYNPGPADGVSGPRTKAAVRDFQLHNDLDQDGIYGPKTQAKLQQVFENQHGS